MRCTDCDEYLSCASQFDLRTIRHRCEKAKGKKKQTNADRIRSMTDEELADYLAWITRGNGGFSPVDYKDKYFPVWLNWLKKETEL